jgi:hypothetical protein
MRESISGDVRDTVVKLLRPGGEIAYQAFGVCILIWISHYRCSVRLKFLLALCSGYET